MAGIVPLPQLVMAGLVPAIHVLLGCVKEAVDARHKAGHDELDCSATNSSY
jgi:hypothetical protein